MRIISFSASNYGTDIKQQKPKKTLINVSNTGYASLIGMGLTFASGMSKNKTIRNSHKYLSILTVAAAIWHLVKVFSNPYKKAGTSANLGELNG